MRLAFAFFWVALTLLALVAALRIRARLKERLAPHSAPPTIDDDALRRILEQGVLRTDEDEPLDWEEIESEERRFWEGEGYWDEAEEF